MAHHQVAPELIVDDGCQQVHQKQAPFKRKGHGRRGPPGVVGPELGVAPRSPEDHTGTANPGVPARRAWTIG